MEGCMGPVKAEWKDLELCPYIGRYSFGNARIPTKWVWAGKPGITLSLW